MAENEYGNLYEYRPSTEAAALFAALFGISTVLHAVQLARGRTWCFLAFLAGGLFETIGYVARAISTEAPQGDDAQRQTFITQTVLILLAPALFAASIYMVFGRLVRRVDGQVHVLIRSQWITKIFVAGDVVSFMTQGAGGGLLGSAGGDESKSDLGSKLIIAGLFVQLAVFGFFIVVVGLFHHRMLRCPTMKAREMDVSWLRHVHVLYAVSALIMARSLFRTAEYIEGRGGHLQTHEVYFYVLDTALMFFVMVLFNVVHPSSILGEKTKEAIPLGSIEENMGSPRH